MQVLTINECDRYYYPEGITSLKEFIEHANAHYHSLIPLDMLVTENCVHPYYIEEDKKRIYINISNMSSISEDEISLLSKSEYEKRLN
jgi:hypothetical protein